ncbi:MAG: hypothetical protein SFX18_07715 [Pirellulales bacterium]|nr:hypothetical protein [Pirellulales bacterium]
MPATPPPTLADPAYLQAALRALSRRSPVLRRLIRQCPRPEFDFFAKRRNPFETLGRAIAHQQLNGTAAKTILGRLCAPFLRGRFPQPAELLDLPDKTIRAAGFSTAKVAALRDLAVKTLDGVVPRRSVLLKLSDEEIIQRLTAVRGIGRWTVEMLLIFDLGRPDVWPVDDFGVRNGFRIAHALAEMPRPRELHEPAEAWRPHRSLAAWYMWRAVELGKGDG